MGDLRFPSCPAGAVCVNTSLPPQSPLWETGNTTLRSLPLDQKYWRPSAISLKPKPCPHSRTCLGGLVHAGSYSMANEDTCKPGLMGPYCSYCVPAWHYFHTVSQSCRDCGTSLLAAGAHLHTSHA